MKPIVVLRHWPSEGPGYLAEFLDQLKLPWSLIAIDQGATIPPTLENIAALVFMGGPMSVNDSLPWIEQEINLIRQARKIGMPVLGHCLGGQLIAKALGGIVRRNSVREIGWLPVSKINHSASEDWLSGLPSSFNVFHWHGETFSLPQGANLILSSPACHHQGFVLDNILALQCHLEMTEELVNIWAVDNSEELAIPSATVQSATQMLINIEPRITELHDIARRIYTRWLRPLLK